MFREKVVWLIDIGSTHLKLMNLHLGKHPYIAAVKVVPYYQTGLVNRPEDLSRLTLTQILKESVRELKMNGKPACALLSSPGALVRNLNLPHITTANTKDAIQFQLIGLLPYDPEKAELDFTIWDSMSDNHSQAAVVGVAPRTEVDWLCEILKHAGLTPILITIDALAVYNALQFFQSEWHQSSLFIHIGARRTIMIYWQADQPPFFHIITFGAENVTQQLASLLSTSYTNAELIKRGDFPLPEPSKEHEKLYYQALHQGLLTPLIPIVQDMINNQRLNSLTTPFEQIVLSGGGALTQDLDFLLARATHLPVNKWNPLQNLPKQLTKQTIPEEWGWHLVPLLGLAFQEGLCV